MKRPQYQPPTPLQQAMQRLNREIWAHRNEITNLEMSLKRLAELQAADEKEIEEHQKRLAAGKAQLAKTAAKKAPGKTKKRDTDRISPAARKRIAAAQKKRWAEHRKRAGAATAVGEPAKPAKDAPASPAKPNFAARMRTAATADEGRTIISEHEAEINRLQRSIGMIPTVGQVDPLRYVGFSVVKGNEWSNVIAAAKKRAPSTGERIRELVRDGVEMDAPWQKLLDAEHKTMNAGGGSQ